MKPRNTCLALMILAGCGISTSDGATITGIVKDTQGRMWYGSPSNNKVGYFTLTAGAERSGN